HKPELVYALTPYQAMNGFREYPVILGLFKKVDVASIEKVVGAFEVSADAEGLEIFFKSILSLDGVVKEAAIKELLEYAENNKKDALFAL
ncbi:mannose-6-phosphate isomerase, partial [Vibrio parahaemolyticus]|nr:mannose-6-phosphate isomerase [Vibrio parahaemolyticus]